MEERELCYSFILFSWDRFDTYEYILRRLCLHLYIQYWHDIECNLINYKPYFEVETDRCESRLYDSPV
jgi:hypothetical protein